MANISFIVNNDVASTHGGIKSNNGPSRAQKRDRSLEQNEIESEDAPKRVKRPMNSFMLFANTRRQELRDANPDVHYRQITSMLGTEWNALPSEEKDVFIKQAREADLAHRQKYPEWEFKPRPYKKKKKVKGMTPTPPPASEPVHIAPAPQGTVYYIPMTMGSTPMQTFPGTSNMQGQSGTAMSGFPGSLPGSTPMQGFPGAMPMQLPGSTPMQGFPGAMPMQFPGMQGFASGSTMPNMPFMMPMMNQNMMMFNNAASQQMMYPTVAQNNMAIQMMGVNPAVKNESRGSTPQHDTTNQTAQHSFSSVPTHSATSNSRGVVNESSIRPIPQQPASNLGINQPRAVIQPATSSETADNNKKARKTKSRLTKCTDNPRTANATPIIQSLASEPQMVTPSSNQSSQESSSKSAISQQLASPSANDGHMQVVEGSIMDTRYNNRGELEICKLTKQIAQDLVLMQQMSDIKGNDPPTANQQINDNVLRNEVADIKRKYKPKKRGPKASAKAPAKTKKATKKTPTPKLNKSMDGLVSVKDLVSDFSIGVDEIFGVPAGNKPKRINYALAIQKLTGVKAPVKQPTRRVKASAKTPKASSKPKTITKAGPVSADKPLDLSATRNSEDASASEKLLQLSFDARTNGSAAAPTFSQLSFDAGPSGSAAPTSAPTVTAYKYVTQPIHAMSNIQNTTASMPDAAMPAMCTESEEYDEEEEEEELASFWAQYGFSPPYMQAPGSGYPPNGYPYPWNPHGMAPGISPPFRMSPPGFAPFGMPPRMSPPGVAPFVMPPRMSPPGVSPYGMAPGMPPHGMHPSQGPYSMGYPPQHPGAISMNPMMRPPWMSSHQFDDDSQSLSEDSQDSLVEYPQISAVTQFLPPLDATLKPKIAIKPPAKRGRPPKNANKGPADKNKTTAMELVPGQYTGQQVMIQGHNGPEFVKLQPNQRLVTLPVESCAEGQQPRKMAASDKVKKLSEQGKFKTPPSVQNRPHANIIQTKNTPAGASPYNPLVLTPCSPSQLKTPQHTDVTPMPVQWSDFDDIALTPLASNSGLVTSQQRPGQSNLRRLEEITPPGRPLTPLRKHQLFMKTPGTC